MWLLIDAGNTRVKWATAQAGERDADGLPVWTQYGAVQHEDLPQLAAQWQGLPVNAALISNVAGDVLQASLQQILQLALPHVPVHRFAANASCAGVRNAYQQPTQLGSDRFASAIAAHALYPGHNVLVVTSGTATTIDAVTTDGVFQGGMILPGLMLMAQALAKNTAQLPQVGNPSHSTPIFADNTQDAIVSGCLTAQTGAIEKAFTALRQQCGEPAFCLLSGGGAAYLQARLDIPHRHVENIVLMGLLQVAVLKLRNGS